MHAFQGVQVQRRVRLAGWGLLALGVVSVAVIVTMGAFRAHEDTDFNRWVGWATVAAVPLGALGILLVVWEKISGSAPAADDGHAARPAREWSLRDDPQTRLHWRPRARGVRIDSERGYRFCGRSSALDAIKSWLDRDELDRRVLVVTGAPGAGKSAVLSRIVTTADPAGVRDLPAWDTAMRASPGSVACAVHAKGKTALEVAAEIAQAASAEPPRQLEDFAPAIRDSLTERGGRRFNVIVDALDEAASPAEARMIISKVILPLAMTCADVGAQLVVGSRHRDHEGDLLAAFGRAMKPVDLDDAQFFDQADLAAYASATLRLAGDERHGNPYAHDDAVTAAVAARIAELSAGNFLVAGLAAGVHGLYDESPADPAQLRFTATVDAAMREYAERMPPVSGIRAEVLLTALAFAEAPGMPASLWKEAVRALGEGEIPVMQLTRFARSSAANFLIESSAEDGKDAVFQLFHQALNDALLKARAELIPRKADEKSLTEGFSASGQQAGWGDAEAYLLRSLAVHAARGGLIDTLLGDGSYLLHAELATLLPALEQAGTEAARLTAAICRGCIEHLHDAAPEDRRWPIAVSAALFGARDLTVRMRPPAAARRLWPRWSTGTPQSALRWTLAGHEDDAVAVACTFVDEQPVAVTGSRDATARVWDLSTGRQIGLPLGHTAGVDAVACTVLGDLPVAVTVDASRIRIWDLRRHQQIRVADVCSATTVACPPGMPLAVTGGGPPAGMQLWDLTRDPLIGQPFGGAPERVSAVDCAMLGGVPVVVSGGPGDAVSVWNLDSRELTGAPMLSSLGRIECIKCCELDGRSSAVVLYCDDDAEACTIGVWDLVSRKLVKHFDHDGMARALACVTIDQRPVVVTGEYSPYTLVPDKGLIHQWDLTGACPIGSPFKDGHQGIHAIAPAKIADRHVIVACGEDNRLAKVWDLSPQRPIGKQLPGHDGPVRQIACMLLNGVPAAVTTGDDRTMRIWDLVAGGQIAEIHAPRDILTLFGCVASQDGRVLAVTSARWKAEVWDLPQYVRAGELRGDGRATISAAVTALHHGQAITIISDRRSVKVWDLASLKLRDILPVDDAIGKLACVSRQDGSLIVIGSGSKGIWWWELDHPRQSAGSATSAGYRPDITGLSGVLSGDQLFAVTTSAVNSGDEIRNGEIHIWDLTCGRVTGTHRTAGGDSVNTVTCTSADNKPVAITGGSGRTLRMWDIVGNKLIGEWPVSGQIGAIACGPDGSLVIGADSDVLVLDTTW